MEVGVLFADIRGFTAWSSSQSASKAAQRVTQFYDLAGRVLMRDDALVEFVGDQVMALYQSTHAKAQDAGVVLCSISAQDTHEPRKSGEGDCYFGDREEKIGVLQEITRDYHRPTNRI